MAFKEDFNSGTLAPGWEVASTSYSIANPPCTRTGDNWNNSFCAWICDDTQNPRALTTQGYDVRLGGKVRYKMCYAYQPGLAGVPPTATACCETPDAPLEGVSLQYSIDGGSNWLDVPGSYQNPNGGNDPVLTKWQQYDYYIPIDALSSSTKFRFYQSTNTGVDHWGIDDVEIYLNDPKFKYSWSHLPNYNGATPPPVAPGATTTYVVSYRDTVGNIANCKDSVKIVVRNFNSATAKSMRYTICPTDTTQLITNSNLFTPAPTTCGITSSGLGNCPIGYSSLGDKVVNVGGTVIDDPTGTSYTELFGSSNSDGAVHQQILYKKAELAALFTGTGISSGAFKSIGFEIESPRDAFGDPIGSVTYNNFKIGIKCVAPQASLTAYSLGGYTSVFPSQNVTIVPGWHTFDFSNAYSWDGISDIIVDICWNMNGTARADANTINRTPGYTCSITSSTNASGSSASFNCSTSGGRTSTERPNTRFGVCYPTPAPNIKFEWTPTAGLSNPAIFNPIATPPTPGANNIYTVKVYDQSYPQCAITDTAKIIVKPTVVASITVPKNRYCQGETINLNASVVPAVAGVTYSWTRNGTPIAGGAATSDVPPAGNIKYTVTPTFGGCPGIAKDTTITVFANPATPTVFAEIKCNSEPGTYTINNNPNPYTSSTKYTWTGPAGFNPVTLTRSVTRNPSLAGPYSIFAKDTLTGCVSVTTNFTVTTNAAPPDPVLSSNGSGLCPGTVLNLNAITENKAAGTAGAGTTRTDTTYTYTYAWTGPGTIINATTKNATVNPTTVGSKTYSFAYNKTTSVTSCTRNPVSGACVGAATVVAGYPVTCPSNSKTVLVDIVDLPSFANRKVVCNGTNDSLAVSFDISGGTPPYTITGTTTGTITGSTFTSKRIPAPGATSYSFDIKDSRNCSAVIVSGTKNCAIACATSLGAITSGSQSVCGGSPATATITYSTSGEDAIVGNATELVLHSGTLPGGTIYQRKPVGATVPFTLQAGMSKGTTYYITAIRGVLSSGNVDLNDGCTEISPRVAVLFNDRPIANVTPLPAEICAGVVDTLLFNFSGTGPYDVTYDDGSTSVTRFNKLDGFREFVTPSSSTTYTITSVKDIGTGCIESSASSLGSADVTIVAAPKAGVASYTCTAAQDSFYVKFPITGGDYMSYTVKDSLGANALTIKHYGVGVDSFISKVPTNNGMKYAYTLSDANNCNPILVTGTFSCKCITDAGTMKTDSIYRLCATASTPSGLSKNDYKLDANDIIRYVLHRGTANKIIDPVDTNTSSVFAFNTNTMVYQVSYYVSAIAANKMASGDLDSLDACLSIAPVGTEVIWNAPAEAAISGNQKICSGGAVGVRFNMLGQAPFKVVYTEGSKTIMLNNVNTPYDTIVYPKTTTIYKLVSIADSRCAGGRVNTTPVTITVDTLDKAKISYTPNVVCITGTGNQMQVNKVTPNGSYTVNSTNLNIHPVSGVINVKLSKVGVYIVKYQTRGNCPNADSTTFRIDTPVVTPSVSYASDEFCKNEMNPSPRRLTPAGGSVIASDPAKLKFVGLNTGIIDLAASTFGNYSVIYRINSTNSCPSKADTVAISINDLPVTTHTVGPRILCVGDPVNVNYVGNSSYNLTWDMGINADVRNSKKHTNTVRWSKPGMQYFTLSVTDQLTKCKSATASDSVLVYAKPSSDFDVSDSLPFTTTVAEQHEFIFSETAFGETEYEWDFGDGSPRVNQSTSAPVRHTYPTAGVYQVSLKVSNPGGCSDTKAKGDIVITGEGDLYIPTGFSPNGDEINDYFKPVPIGIKSMSFIIFSRWGEFIYRGTLNDKGWDGTFKNAPAPDGAYVYIIEEATTFENANKTYPAGIVTLSR